MTGRLRAGGRTLSIAVKEAIERAELTLFTRTTKKEVPRGKALPAGTQETWVDEIQVAEAQVLLMDM